MSLSTTTRWGSTRCSTAIRLPNSGGAGTAPLAELTRRTRRAGVRPVLFHDLPHTFGTRMARAGVALRTLQEWMGHRDFKVRGPPVRPAAPASDGARGRRGIRSAAAELWTWPRKQGVERPRAGSRSRCASNLLRG